MSTETDPKPEPSLDESVETLLSEMSQTAARLGDDAARLGDQLEPASESAGVEEPLQDLAAAVDEMVREVSSAVSSAVTPVVEEPERIETPETTEATEEEPADTFASLSDEMLAGLDSVALPERPANTAASPVEEPNAGVAPAADPFSSLTDELLSGLGDTPVPPEPIAVVVPMTVSAAVAAASEPAASATAATEAQRTTTTARRVLHAAGHAGLTVGLAAAHKIEPHALRAAAAISAPLSTRPRVLRDTIGWLGVYTLFVGLTLGVYVRFIHTAPAPAPAHPGVKLAEQHDRKGAAGEVVRTEAGGTGNTNAEKGAEVPKADKEGKKEDGKSGAEKKGEGKVAAPKLPVPAFKPGPEKHGAGKDAKKDAKK